MMQSIEQDTELYLLVDGLTCTPNFFACLRVYLVIEYIVLVTIFIFGMENKREKGEKGGNWTQRIFLNTKNNVGFPRLE